jgi:menaquinol-cytochrome c reductase iron-sulfur subunit
VSDSDQIDRRNFVKIIVASVGGFISLSVGIPAIIYTIEPAVKVQSTEGWISAGLMENYETDKPTLFTFTQTKQNGWERTVNSYGVYVTKQSETTATVFSNQCTHLACRVTWQEENQEYFCPCHNGIFNKEGDVVDGPPPKPLIPYETKVEEGILYFYFTEA